MQHWFTSDIHRSHNNIIKYSKRPFTNVEEMNQHILKSWDSVNDGDTLWSLGDFAFERIEKTISFLEAANSRRFDLRMVLGNHDEEIIKNREQLLASGLVKEITSYKEIKIEGQFIVLFHYGCRVWNKGHHGSWLLYGHSHGTLPPLGKSVDVGLDAPFVTGQPEYRPFNFKEIKKFMDKQPTYAEDYHGKDREKVV